MWERVGALGSAGKCFGRVGVACVRSAVEAPPPPSHTLTFRCVEAAVQAVAVVLCPPSRPPLLPPVVFICCRRVAVVAVRGRDGKRSQKAERAGTPGFRAPEVLMRVEGQTCGSCFAVHTPHPTSPHPCPPHCFLSTALHRLSPHRVAPDRRTPLVVVGVSSALVMCPGAWCRSRIPSVLWRGCFMRHRRPGPVSRG